MIDDYIEPKKSELNYNERDVFNGNNEAIMQQSQKMSTVDDNFTRLGMNVFIYFLFERKSSQNIWDFLYKKIVGLTFFNDPT